jgi:hypothetical protein
MKLEVTLSEKEVKEIIKEHLRKKFKCVGEVEINVGTKYNSIGQFDGWHEGKFNNIKAQVEV